MPASYARATLVAVALATMLSACADDEGPLIEEAYVEEPVERLYNDAMNQLVAQEFDEAAVAFEEVDRQHPYSRWATRAQLMAAYSYFESAEYDDAIIALDRFIRLHPGNEDIAYAYYLRALSYYEQISDVERDQALTQFAMDSLRDVVARFPQTEYARDARLKLDLTVDHLAGKEMAIGRYYLRQKEFVAAINRFEQVIRTYQSTTHVPEALYRMVEAYTALGLTREAQRNAAVLGHNYPGSDWYAQAFLIVKTGNTTLPEPESASFLDRLF